MHTLNSIARNRWGYNSKSSKLLYTADIEPILLYGCEIWGTAIDKIHIKRKLLSAQRLSAISITKAYRTAPGDALLVIADLIPIDLKIKERIWKYYQIKYAINNISKDNFDKTIQKIGIKEPAIEISNIITKEKLDYYPNIHVFHPTISLPIKLTENLDNNNNIKIYTDGSKTDTGVGCSVVVRENKKNIHQAHYKLATYCTINQSESLVIFNALKWVLKNLKQINNKGVTIYSDSKVALQQLKKLNANLPIVFQSIKIIITLQDSININLNWVKGHSSNPGNDRADLLARKASDKNLNISYNRIPLTWLHQKIRSYIQTKWQERWEKSTTGRLTYQFFPQIQKRIKNKHFVPSFNITQILMEHGNFRAYLHRFLGKTNGKCSCNLQEDEDSQHVIYSCPIYSNERKRLIEQIRENNELWPCELSILVSNKDIYKDFKTFLKAIKILE
ncbi:uncharacterized protein LOC111642457 [Centruroides sculpturatus]|uniref:uncharacterized protein LOC111642457 n=1 Tax=Centruroides sculpturatus TaxID=218467 RepID=UPI000C6D436B|nr:uncharacterized protein LOC111642457 [Centruroides sculpturatus]